MLTKKEPYYSWGCAALHTKEYRQKRAVIQGNICGCTTLHNRTFLSDQANIYLSINYKLKKKNQEHSLASIELRNIFTTEIQHH